MSNFETSTLETIEPLNGPGEYIYRTGDAPVLITQKNQTHEGVISAPFNFYSDKYLLNKADIFQKKDMLVKFSLQDKVIVFTENNSTTENCTTIKGHLKYDPDLLKMGINSNKTYTSQQLADLLKFNRSLFESSDECMNLVTKLKNFTASVTNEINNIDDKQGTKTIGFAQKIKHELNLSFVLKCTVFIGVNETAKFKVEIMFDLRDKAIEFWLESVELKEISDHQINDIIQNEIKHFIQNDIPTIQIG